MTTTGPGLMYEECLDEPYTLSRFDIGDGEVIFSAGPTRPQQIISRNVYRTDHSLINDSAMSEGCCKHPSTS